MKYDKNCLKILIRKDRNIKIANYNTYNFSKYSIIILSLNLNPKIQHYSTFTLEKS